MPVSHAFLGSNTRIEADGNFTIVEARDIAAKLTHALETAQSTLEVDLSAIEEIDSAGVQLLLILKREAAQQNKILHYSNHPPRLLNIIELLNLGGHLGDPLLITKIR